MIKVPVCGTDRAPISLPLPQPLTTHKTHYY